jgi:hypothetical protein
MGDKKLGVDSSIVNGCNILDLSLKMNNFCFCLRYRYSKTLVGKPAIYHSLAPLLLTIHDWLETRQGFLVRQGMNRTRVLPNVTSIVQNTVAIGDRPRLNI